MLLWSLGCTEQDSLHLSRRKVAGRYMLERFEGGTFYLQKQGTTKEGGGCLDGTVQRIGWSNGLIFAKRQATFRGDQDGWMIIDVASQSMTGPLSDTEFRHMFPSVQTLSPEDAWKEL